MIQRIQSVYLFLTTLFSVLFLNGNIIKFSNASKNVFVINLKGLSKVVADSPVEQVDKLIPLIILLLLIPVLSLITVFLFKKRKLQLRLATGLIITVILLIAALAYYSVSVIRDFNVEIIPGIRLILPLLMLICSYLGYRGINKDENLVRSYDRLR